MKTKYRKHIKTNTQTKNSFTVRTRTNFTETSEMSTFILLHTCVVFLFLHFKHVV